ncbi:MAG TPA: ATP-binding cassette domain-containing protein [Acidimicrobiales bacterium]|nr:ATP-binding cassette domain-containing protein [Acidimicrobiales bacterium]
MIRLQDVSKRYGDGAFAVEHLDLQVDEGELCVLVGPSGCGKTTTLKMINRLIEPTSGRILLNGEDVTTVDVVALRRRIGYVIQQGGLFPHERVADNVATVPKLLGWDRARIAARVDDMLRLVGLPPEDFGRRFPHELSGGQRQRVGVARALAADPPVLLMDEPFGAVDPLTRARLQQEFKDLQARLRKTVVFVTHDVDEAVLLGDRIALLRQGGVLEQYGTPAELLDRPASAFASDFLGADRGLRRLAVLRVSADQVRHPPVVQRSDAATEARAAAIAAGWTWAAVVDDERIAGWLPASDGAGSGPGPVAATMRPVAGRVQVGDSLRVAFSTLLEGTDGWVAVERDGRFVGVLTAEDLSVAARDGLDGAS